MARTCAYSFMATLCRFSAAANAQSETPFACGSTYRTGGAVSRASQLIHAGNWNGAISAPPKGERTARPGCEPELHDLRRDFDGFTEAINSAFENWPAQVSVNVSMRCCQGAMSNPWAAGHPSS
jgi:hypothetical protein